jgi:hypothetical protein
MGVVRVPLWLAVAALVAVLLVPSSAGAVSNLEMAVQDDSVFVSREYYNRDKAFTHLQELKTTHLRVNVLWAAVVGKSAGSRTRPKKIKYDFVSYDQLVVAARAKGLQVQMALTGPAPAWAAGNRKRGPYKPNAKLYADFVKATVSHFHSLVGRYSIWNEPNHVGWLAPVKSQPSLYRSLYKAGYSAAKKANKNAQVLIGETAPYARNSRTAQAPLKFLRSVVKGQKLRADGFAHHPYDYEHGPDYQFPGGDNVTIGTLGRLTSALDAYAKNGSLRTPGGGALDVWLTEFGYFRTGRFKIPDETRGNHLKRAYDIARANPRVRQMLHFLLIEPPKKYAFFDTSIVSRKGKGSAAFTALAQWAQAAFGGGGGGGGGGGTGGGGTPPPPPPPCYLPGTTVPCP